MNKLTVSDEIILSKVTLSDANNLYAILDEHRKHFRRWLPFVDYLMDVSEMEDYVKSIEDSDKSGDHVFVIIYKGDLVGLVGLKDSDYFNNSTEVGYWLSPNYEGKGIMTLSVNKIVDYAFNSLDMHRIQLRCAEKNEQSEAVALRTGFIYEALIHDGELMVDGSYANLKLYYQLNTK